MLVNHSTPLRTLLVMATLTFTVTTAQAATITGSNLPYIFGSITATDPISYTDIHGNDIIITGGFDSGYPESDRPVDLIGAMFGITGAQFTQAFSGVTPSTNPNGPTPEEEAANQAILLAALQVYDPTIQSPQINAITNYYRFAPGGTEGIWPHTPAEIAAIIDGSNGLIGFEIISGGDGYHSAPTISVNGVVIDVDVTLGFVGSIYDPSFNEVDYTNAVALAALDNGEITSISLATGIPTPAALPAGLALLGLIASRRRRC